MKNSIKIVSICMMLWAGLASTAHAVDAADIAEQRTAIREKTKQILSDLYAVEPLSKRAVEKSAGYAVFSNFGMRFLVAGGGTGKGQAINPKSKQEIFMKMVEVQAGIGFGIKTTRLIFVFENKQAWQQFVNSGWEASAQASAAAKSGDAGAAYQGAVSISPGVWLYQLTDQGLALELTVKGTKYYRDDELN
jgi:lipid-binding SYLF domain-containing protein